VLRVPVTRVWIRPALTIDLQRFAAGDARQSQRTRPAAGR
jgi:hypothetical protein